MLVRMIWKEDAVKKGSKEKKYGTENVIPCCVAAYDKNLKRVLFDTE